MCSATCQSTEDLQHSAGSESRDTMIHSRSVIEECVHGHPFIEVWHICTRVSRLEMLVERVMNSATVVLCCLVKHNLDFVSGCPSKEQLQLFWIRKQLANLIWCSVKLCHHSFKVRHCNTIMCHGSHVITMHDTTRQGIAVNVMRGCNLSSSGICCNKFILCTKQ